MNKISFDKKVAIVTGAGAGIGRSYALELAKRGAAVVVNDLGGSRDGRGEGHEAADKVVAEITAAGGKAVASYDSVTTMEGGAAIIETALTHFESLDILINNAGILRDQSFHKMSEEQWDTVINVHLKGAFCVTQPAVRAMKENGYGRILFTVSNAGLYGSFGQANYSAAKMGIIGLMNALKLEVKKFGIKVNAISPTAHSRMTEDIMPYQITSKMAADLNAPMALYLCSDANRYTGLTVTTGAGWFGQSAVISGHGLALGQDVSVEDVRDNINAILSLEDGAPHTDGLSFLLHEIGPALE
ncbi:SDR family oxidoreductase [Desulfoluna sp.]|uniref:SDR family oxidoreductase n=1 Tax=Desulfoluna sp. TaxID=2045199 RepID=UPI00260CCEE4|nr:SDR family oxidoreductase [Desulfoluna sp.]